MENDNINNDESTNGSFNNEIIPKIDSSVLQNSNDKNIKPFLGVVVALIVILLAYYFLWRSIAVKTKSIVAESLSDFQYESISLSGFPFYKTIKIKNIDFDDDIPVIARNNVKVEDIKISSFIFGSSFNITLKNILITLDDGTKYNLLYNGVPNITISFYPNGAIKYFEYKDSGYRVLDSLNKTLYTAGETVFKIDTTQSNNKLDYSIYGTFKDMQNLSLIDEKNNIDTSVIPEIFNLNFDISSSLTENKNIIESYIIKINSFNLIGNNGNGFKIVGEIVKDSDDIYSYGNLELILLNYKNTINKYRNKIIDIINTENNSKIVNEKNKKSVINIINNFFNALEKVIKDNKNTTDNNGVISLIKKKNAPDYLINNSSLYSIIQDIYKND